MSVSCRGFKKFKKFKKFKIASSHFSLMASLLPCFGGCHFDSSKTMKSLKTVPQGKPIPDNPI